VSESNYDHEVDLLIVGAGPAGLYAAYYAGFRALSVVVVDSLTEPGGQLAALYPEKAIYDVGGIPSILGRELAGDLYRQAQTYNPTFLLGHGANALSTLDDGTLAVSLRQNSEVREVVMLDPSEVVFGLSVDCAEHRVGVRLAVDVSDAPRIADDFRALDMIVPAIGL